MTGILWAGADLALSTLGLFAWVPPGLSVT